MKTILLIEDNLEMRENTSEILELNGYKVIPAKNGKEGVELAQKNKADLIICDIMMPVLDGYGVLHLLAKKPETASIPFIFLTAKAERTDFRKGMEMGADDYLTKPFNDIELINAIESRFKKNEVLRKEFSKNIEGLNDFFNSVKSLEEFVKLSGSRVNRAYKKKQVIYSENSYPNGLFFIIKGKAKTYKTNEDGKEFITGLFKEGDFIGYKALLEEGQYSESAAALEDSEVCLVAKEDFFDLIYKNSEVSKKFIKMLSDNVVEKEKALLDLAYNSVRKRIAQALTELKKRYQKEDAGKFSMSILREDLANLAGTSQETTIRTLGDFKEEKLIEISGGTITIINSDKLEKMKN
jgi:CRP/FNR family transcriptional regulator, polysaccharide utilization system transcription regulator